MEPAEESDEILALKLASLGQNQEARRIYDSLYDRHRRDTQRFITCRADQRFVDDIQQELWLKVWRFGHQFTAGLSFRAWLYRIAKNTIIDFVRAHNRNKSTNALLDDDVAVDRRITGSEWFIDDEERQLFASCLAQLDPHSRHLVQGRCCGVTIKELSQQLNQPLAKMYKVLNSAVQKLTTCVGRKRV